MDQGPRSEPRPITIPTLFGRDADLAIARQFLEAASAGPASLVLEGEPGIGKTSLWLSTLVAAQARSWAVLTAQPGESEAALSFSALTDLLSGVGHEDLDTLPGPQRRAVDIALLRIDHEGALPDHRALATGFLSVLVGLARRSPVLVAVDDAQWLDGPSCRVLEFAIRRLTAVPVGIAISGRSDAAGVPSGLRHALPAHATFHLQLGPLKVDELHRMIENRLGASFPRRVLLRVAETSAGNPLFALEIARALRASDRHPRPGEALPIPTTLADLVAQRLADLPSETRELLSFVSATANPTLDLLDSIAAPQRAVDVLDHAETAGILSIDGQRVRFTHPLLAAGVWSSTMPSARLRLHRRLSELVADPEERARHLAALVGDSDESVALALAVAARRALERGAPDAAGDLYEQAMRLTPETRADDRWRRAIDAANCQVACGDADHARELLEAVRTGATSGPLRAEALVSLANISRFDSLISAIGLLEQAAAEAGEDAALRSAIERQLSFVVTASGNAIDGFDHARTALELLEGSEDDGALAEAEAHLTMTGFLLGHGVSPDRMAWAQAHEARAAYLVPLESRPSFIHGLILLWMDQPEAARVVLDDLRRDLRDEGDERGLRDMAWARASVELSCGDLTAAMSEVEEAMAATEMAGPGSTTDGLALAPVQALIRAWQGDVEGARAAAQPSLARAMQTGFAAVVGRSLHALGFLELSLGNALAAHRHLSLMAELHLKAGLREPGVLGFVPDEIEALIALGELEKATAMLEPFEERARTLNRRTAVAGAARCRALLSVANGDTDAALVALGDALAAHLHVVSRLELARTLFVKGRVHRRRKEKRAARESLGQALEIFEAAGARLWENATRGELARIGCRPPAPMELTGTEQRVAELAARGLTNRQVAEVVFLTAKSVEGVLARVYRKLGISSRAELGATMAARRSESLAG
jgi:DNA-binding CsgD family transcriptional regulator